MKRIIDFIKEYGVKALLVAAVLLALVCVVIPIVVYIFRELWNMALYAPTVFR